GADELANDLADGAAILDRAAGVVPGAATSRIRAASAALRDPKRPVAARVSGALDLAELLWEHPVRDLVTTDEQRRIWVDRPGALFSAWYEMFPRSEGEGSRHGTFATAARRLPAIAAMGFDVVYLPPIHPIGRVNRKGRNAALIVAAGDVGSPWA